MEEFNPVVYESVIKLLEKKLSDSYRDSARNDHNYNPIYPISIINKRVSEDGFEIQGTKDEDLIDLLTTYSNKTNRIKINLNDKTFQLTDDGKKRMTELDPQIL